MEKQPAAEGTAVSQANLPAVTSASFHTLNTLFSLDARTHRGGKWVFLLLSPGGSKVSAWGKSAWLNALTSQGCFVGVSGGRAHSISMKTEGFV